MCQFQTNLDLSLLLFHSLDEAYLISMSMSNFFLGKMAFQPKECIQKNFKMNENQHEHIKMQLISNIHIRGLESITTYVKYLIIYIIFVLSTNWVEKCAFSVFFGTLRTETKLEYSERLLGIFLRDDSIGSDTSKFRGDENVHNLRGSS